MTSFLSIYYHDIDYDNYVNDSVNDDVNDGDYDIDDYCDDIYLERSGTSGGHSQLPFFNNGTEQLPLLLSNSQPGAQKHLPKKYSY
jgi:hypothetical protein